MADISRIKLPSGDIYNLIDDNAARGNASIFYGTCNTEANAAIKVVTCTEFTASDLKPGAVINVFFSVTNSAAASSLQLNVNETGAKSIKYVYNGSYTNIPNNHLKLNQIYQFIYDGTYWIVQMMFDTNNDTTGYLIRNHGLILPVSDVTGPYRLLFTSLDGTHWVPATASSSTNATAIRDVNTTKIDPFGRIVFYYGTSTTSAGKTISAQMLWQQHYLVTLGYSFNRTGAALTLTSGKPVYVKCTPQADGSAIIDADIPYVQDLPSTEDGKIYIWLGIAHNAITIELTLEHPVYEYKNGKIRQYIIETDPVFGASVAAGITSGDISNWNGKTSNTGTITSVKTTAGQHTTINVTSGAANFNVPTNTSHLTNDSGFLTLATLPIYNGTVE